MSFSLSFLKLNILNEVFEARNLKSDKLTIAMLSIYHIIIRNDLRFGVTEY